MHIGNPEPRRKPTVFKTYFSEYAVGAQPPDWTKRYATTGFDATVQTVSGSLGGQALRITKLAATKQILSWDKIPARPDIEILVRGRAIEAPATPQALIRPCARGSGAAGSESLMSAVAYYHTSAAQDWRGAMQKYVAGTVTQIDAATDGPAPIFAVNQWFWMRFRTNGTSHQRRQWWQGSAEPGTWDTTTADSSVTAGGWVGLYNLENNPDIEVDFFSVGINGRSAPGP